jgi:hypothetical protein
MRDETTMDALRKRQQAEVQAFIDGCLHNNVKVEQDTGFNKHGITIRCAICGLNLVGYMVDGSHSYCTYIRDCVKAWPGNVRKGWPKKEEPAKNEQETRQQTKGKDRRLENGEW